MRPSNILIHGRSGSGKTEIFRRVAKIYNAPFMRVEATRYTEVGYHGDDIRNIIVDLFKKTQSEYQEKSGETVLQGSQLIKDTVHEYLLKCILGGHDYQSNPAYASKKQELEDGLLDDYECYLQMYMDDQPDPTFTNLKVKTVRK
jgi:ATP-dependent HslUV protease ATP-binding subunit HslU